MYEHFEPSTPTGPTNAAAQSFAGQFNHPADVLDHPGMTKAEKRAVLAAWASDAHAVSNAPALRQLDNGAVVGIDEILQALRSLDDAADSHRQGPKWQPFARRKNVLSRLRGTAIRERRSDDDDDPPPCPAAAGVPVRMSFVAACAGRRGWLPPLAPSGIEYLQAI